MSRWTGLPAGFRRPNSRAPRGRDSGFTLLEVMVALAILAVAMGVILQLFSTGLKGGRLAERRAVAALLAQSKLAAVGVESPLEEGQSEGRFERDYRWRVAIAPYQEQGRETLPEGGPAAYEVVVTVSWGDPDRAESSLSLATLRLAAPETE